jgi:taurine dioxygenase
VATIDSVQVRAMSGALGAEIRGLDLETIDEDGVASLEALIHEHLVVFLPDQHLSVAGHHRLGSMFGEIVENSYTPGVDDAYPGVTVHRSTDGYVADVWHSDGQPRPAPIKFTIFKMMVSPSRGGDTMWSNQYLVYERLSAPMRALLDGLTARQQSLVNPNEASNHPAVIEHPVTGRRLLYLSRAHSVRLLELTAAESRVLIAHLVEVATQPEFVCRYRWAPGTIGIWDNLATVHYGVNDFDEPREFHRVMVQGPVLAENAGCWPASDDGRPRLMVRKDGTAGVVGQMTDKLWATDQ